MFANLIPYGQMENFKSIIYKLCEGGEIGIENDSSIITYFFPLLTLPKGLVILFLFLLLGITFSPCF